MSSATEKVYTPEELFCSETGADCELLNGRLVAKSGGMEASVVAVTLLTLLCNHAKAQSLGHVLGGRCGYQIFAEEPNNVRKPDGSFIVRGRLPDDKPVRAHATIAPDLAFEVVSPDDLAEEIDARVGDYLQAGVRLLWVVYPATHAVWVFRPDGSVSRLGASAELSGEDVVPGFRCRVAEVFADI